MRSIGARFVLIVVAFATAFSAYLIVQGRRASRAHLEEMLAAQAELAMEFDLAIRAYVAETIRPWTAQRVSRDEFVPNTMSSSYVARSVFDKVRRRLPHYVIKFSSDNPRNPANRASPVEETILAIFRADPTQTAWTGEIELEGKQYFAQCYARRMEQSCLQCHGRPEDAPASLRAQYGREAGFHRTVGEVIAMDTVAIPMEEMNALLAGQAQWQLPAVAIGIVVLLGSILLAFQMLVGRRLRAIAEHLRRAADRVEDASLEPIPVEGRDEIGVLAASFNALVSRLRGYHATLEQRVAERTAALTAEVSERQRIEDARALDEARLQALVQLNEMTDASISEITDFALEQGVALTKSKVGYLAFLSEDETVLTMHSWSKTAMRECGIPNKPFVYPLATTGLWGETVRQRRPILTNDYAASNPLKKGYPAGHVAIERHLGVPVFDGARIVVVTGVGNKATQYDETDVRQLTLLMQGMWRLLERRRAEHARQQYAAKLEATNQALEEARRSAEAATRAKSEFLANMSHEIRTPMTSILGYTELLAEQCLPTRAPNQAAVAEYLATVSRNAEHLLQVVNDILDLSKIEAGKLEVLGGDCSPHEVLAEVVSMMTLRAEAKGIQLTVSYDGPLPERIRSDATRLRQILINLVGNAVKFTETGAVRLEAGLRTGGDRGGQLEIRVKDTGIGIAPEQMELLFTPFSQADTSPARIFGGSGLGLAISRRLAEMLGGTIVVESELGQGSCFTLRVATGELEGVRLVDAPAAHAPPADPRPTPNLDCRVLLAEDGVDNRRLISLLLKKSGAEVHLAEHGRAAVDLALRAHQEGRAFDVILMDMQMPILDGYEATRRLRSAGYGGPIIALTAHAMIDDRQRCLDAGCNDYVSKPVDRSGLLDHVAKWAKPAQAPAASGPPDANA